MRLAFMGSPDFAVPALDALVEAGHDVAAVYAQPPRPAGRGKKDRPTAVHARAEVLGLEVRTPKSLRDTEAQAAFAALNLDVAVVAAYGLILPKPILNAPKQGCLNIHPSLLPRWRGAAPIQRAVMAGDTRTGVCIMQMETGLDTGPVLMREETDIAPQETAAMLHDRLAKDGARMLVETLSALDTLTPEPQSENGVTYAAKIDKAEARIDWTRPADEVRAHIMGLSPFPGAWFEAKGERIKAHFVTTENANGTPGTVLDEAGLIACGTGAVRLSRVQRAGKPAMDLDAVLRGFPLPAGTMLA
jgi:methionyl-tRNA formyltransferase